MLIDWITARIPVADLPPMVQDVCRGWGDRVMRYCPKTGNIAWESAAWESVRSDSHQIAVKVAGDLWMQGSPARVMGDGDTVFGSGASAALDLRGCVDRMARFVATLLDLPALPEASAWTVSRVDVTGNLLLPSLVDVRSALSILRDCEGGRYRVSQQSGDTVYWSHLSKLRSGKAYAKGPHLLYLEGKRTYTGRGYGREEVDCASRLLRLELKLGREYWRRNEWQNADAGSLRHEWETYFSRMIGDAEMNEKTTDIRERIEQYAPTKGQAASAHATWALIKNEGWERARDLHTKTTWYRNLKTLRAAGFGDADFSAGVVVPLRRRILEAQLVTSWDELMKAA